MEANPIIKNLLNERLKWINVKRIFYDRIESKKKCTIGRGTSFIGVQIKNK